MDGRIGREQEHLWISWGNVLCDPCCKEDVRVNILGRVAAVARGEVGRSDQWRKMALRLIERLTEYIPDDEKWRKMTKEEICDYGWAERYGDVIGVDNIGEAPDLEVLPVPDRDEAELISTLLDQGLDGLGGLRPEWVTIDNAIRDVLAVIRFNEQMYDLKSIVQRETWFVLIEHLETNGDG